MLGDGVMLRHLFGKFSGHEPQYTNICRVVSGGILGLFTGEVVAMVSDVTGSGAKWRKCEHFQGFKRKQGFFVNNIEVTGSRRDKVSIIVLVSSVW